MTKYISQIERTREQKSDDNFSMLEAKMIYLQFYAKLFRGTLLQATI